MMTERVLDYLWGRQIVTLNNIANVDTPGFKAQYVTFEEELAHRIQNAAKRPNPRNGIAHAIGQTRVGVNTTWLINSNESTATGTARPRISSDTWANFLFTRYMSAFRLKYTVFSKGHLITVGVLNPSPSSRTRRRWFSVWDSHSLYLFHPGK